MHNIWAMQTQHLMTSAEVCSALGIDRSTLSRWVAAGRIEPAVKAPGKRGAFLFSKASVEAVVKSEAAS